MKIGDKVKTKPHYHDNSSRQCQNSGRKAIVIGFYENYIEIDYIEKDFRLPKHEMLFEHELELL